MHPVRRLSVFCRDSETRAQAYGNARLFLRFIRCCSKILEETNLFPPESFSNPTSTSWL